MRNIISLLFIFLLVFTSQAYSWNTLTSDLDVNCHQVKKELDCEYRVLNDGSASSIAANSNDLSLKISNNSSYPQSGDITAILFLVDTSDPARQIVINKIKTQIKEILGSLKPHQKIGLASFDKSLKLQSPIGTSSFLFIKSLDNLKAVGKTTELYRNLLKAMEHLNSFEAKRKVIVLLSDGQAEDKAYFHSDVIKMARKTGIIINSIGYPRSVALSVALQTLRRLSEETGGHYIETDTTYNLPENELEQIFNNIDNGGNFTVKLDELYKSDAPTNSVTLSFTTTSGVKKIEAPVTIDIKKRISKQQIVIPEATDIQKAIVTAQTADNSAPIQIITKQATPQSINLWLWYGLPAAFIIIIIFILITLFLLWRKPEQSTNSSSSNDYRPYAYLIANDESETRYPITRTICRIGRSKDNELHLDDASISRRHAEIHRNNNGSFDIIDMNSMNGVYVNNEKVGKAQLQEGDLLEIGDYFLRFTQLAADYSLEESTVMQKTRTPTIN